jgi:hypothetical protein
MRKIINIGNALFGFEVQWASDGYWQYTLKNDDRITDIVSVQLLKRTNEPRLLLAKIGPLLVVLTICSSKVYSV